MLFLIFELGRDRYAIDVRQIAEVLPLVAVTRVAGAPKGMDGLFNYRGAPVPLVDLAQVTLGRPSARRLSTRIVLVYYPDDAGRSHLLGLVAERATRTASHEPSEFVPSGITSTAAPYLGGIATDAQGLLQRMDIATLLPPSFRDLLFKAPAGH
ncbi:MAG: chemotaxis protein CheW [Acidobacteriota bacterium]